MKKNKVINVATCDARGVTEESLAGYENITINAATLIMGERSKELLNRYPVTMNVSNVLEIPDNQAVTVKSINGKGEIGADTDGTGIFLMVNGKLVITDGSKEAVKSYYHIMVNGKALAPKSCEGCLSNIQVNGTTEYYPDGATIIKADIEIDDLFIERAANSFYYCSGNLFFLDTGIDTEKMIEKKLKFAAKKIVIVKSLVTKLISIFDEETEIVQVPDGTRLINDDVEFKTKIIRKYGTKLCVCGNVSIQESEALASLEYLFADGTVSVDKELEDAFDEIDSVYTRLKVIDPELGYITDLPMVKIGTAVLKKYPKGVQVEDCATVRLSKELSAEDIIEKLHISDCAVVVCTKEQEEAVSVIAEDVAMIGAPRKEQEDGEDEKEGGIFSSFLNELKDTQVINAAEYKM